MSHVHFKKWQCCISLLLIFPNVTCRIYEMAMSNVTVIFSPCCVALCPMLYEKFKKCPGRPVDFRGLGPSHKLTHDPISHVTPTSPGAPQVLPGIRQEAPFCGGGVGTTHNRLRDCSELLRAAQSCSELLRAAQSCSSGSKAAQRLLSLCCKLASSSCLSLLPQLMKLVIDPEDPYQNTMSC